MLPPTTPLVDVLYRQRKKCLGATNRCCVLARLQNDLAAFPVVMERMIYILPSFDFLHPCLPHPLFAATTATGRRTSDASGTTCLLTSSQQTCLRLESDSTLHYYVPPETTDRGGCCNVPLPLLVHFSLREGGGEDFKEHGRKRKQNGKWKSLCCDFVTHAGGCQCTSLVSEVCVKCALRHQCGAAAP